MALLTSFRSQLLISAIMILKPFSSFVPVKGFLNQLQFPFFFSPFQLALQPDAVDHAVGRHELAAAVELRHLFDTQLRQIVVLIREITRRPHQASRGRFRLDLFSQFDLPVDALIVHDVEFGGAALLVFFDEREFPGGLVFFAAGPIEEVERRMSAGRCHKAADGTAALDTPEPARDSAKMMTRLEAPRILRVRVIG